MFYFSLQCSSRILNAAMFVELSFITDKMHFTRPSPSTFIFMNKHAAKSINMDFDHCKNVFHGTKTVKHFFIT